MATPASQGALSSQQLQSHYNEIHSHMSILALSILPRQMASTLATHSLDATASRLAKKACAALHECQVCGCSCEPDDLQLLLTTNLEFHTRAVHVTAARFVCAQCAAVSSCNLMLQLLTPDVGAEADESRAAQLHQLCLHFAAVNNAPASVTASPDALALWVQELACRAYSLCVVANSLRGWTLHPAGCSITQILQQLLKTDAKPAKGQTHKLAAAGAAAITPGKKSKTNKQQEQLQQPAPEPHAPAAASKRARAAAAAATPQAGAVATPRSKKLKHRHSTGADTAADVGGRVDQRTPAAHKQQQKQQLQRSLKKHKHGSKQAAHGVAAGVGCAPSAAAGGKSKPGVGGAGELRTPQHSKAQHSSKKRKLLMTAPR